MYAGISTEELVNYYEMNEEERDRWEQDLSANLSVEFYDPRNFIRWIIRELPFHCYGGKRLLTIPATSGTSERTFSRAGLTITKRRTLLNSDMAATLIFLNSCMEEVVAFNDKNN
jgi:hypothetical protein